MDPERWRRIEELYHAALERQPGQRGAFLAEGCNADEELRREVESLLAQDVSHVLERPAPEVAASLLERSTVTQSVVGTQLGPYRIEAVLGAGGMGKVYKARDTRLGRAVAIKIANEQFGARFAREARAISSLNHPHICTLHDVGPNYLVMELVEGDTLASRLRKGPLPIELVVQYGMQIADALAAAHALGITHRDLKPGNVMIAKTGVKLLDFGLAKMAAPPEETITVSQAVMGTPAYMAPEQREGKACDARTDIFALGLVLSEMATGKGPTHGQRPVLDGLPAQFAHVAERCLVKEPEGRWQTATDVKAELEWAGKSQPPGPAVAVKRRDWRGWAVAGLAVVAAVAGVVWFRGGSATREPVRFTIEAPENTEIAPARPGAALSPDGRRVAFIVRDASAMTSIWIRSLDAQQEPQRLTGTEGAVGLFWSPDGQFVGFFAPGKLKKIAIAGGPAQNICNTALGLGAAWSPSGDIVFNPLNRAALLRVSAAGGTPQPLTMLDASRQENSHRWPSFLPDGRHFLFTARSNLKENTAIYVGSLDSSETKLLLTEQSNAMYAPPGYLLFVRDGTLMAQRFDVAKLTFAGDAAPVTGGVDQEPSSAVGSFSVSANGSALAYTAASRFVGRLTWFDRAGSDLGFVGADRTGVEPRLSPDGKRLAVMLLDPVSGNRDVWLVELGTGTRTRFTSNAANDWQPAWSPNGADVVFVSDRSPPSSVYRKAVDGSSEEELFVKPSPESGDAFQPEWSPDGRFLAYITAKQNGDLWIAPLVGDRTPRSFLATEFWEWQPRFSPDGKWVAYDSNESGGAGAFEVYLRPTDGPGKQRVSTGGGSFPMWRRDGRELFYLAPTGTLMATDVRLGESPSVSPPKVLFKMCNPAVTNDGPPYFDVTADGMRFIVSCASPGAESRSISIAVPWTQLVKWPGREAAR